MRFPCHWRRLFLGNPESFSPTFSPLIAIPVNFCFRLFGVEDISIQGMSRYWVIALIILATAVVYSFSFPGQFHFDDYPLMLENDRVAGDGMKLVDFPLQYGGRPLTLWTFRLNYLAGGERPWHFLLVNILLHLACVGLLTNLLWKATEKPVLASMAGLIFAVHPLQTQAVNYIWSRSVLLMAVFSLLALLLWRKRPAAAVAAYQLAMWSRVEAVLLIVPMLVWRKQWRALLIGLAVWNAAAAFYFFGRHQPAEFVWNHSDLLGYWSGQVIAFWKYVSLALIPARQTIDHQEAALGAWSVAFAVAALAALIGWALKRRATAAPAAYGILWWALFLFPSLLIPNPDFLNESRAYLPMAGLAAAAGFFLSRMALWNAKTWAAAGLLLAVMSGLSIQRNQIWNDDAALWKEATMRSPQKGRAFYNYGVALLREDRVRDATRAFETAAGLDGDDDFSYAALAYCAELEQEWEKALNLYQRALQMNPQNEYAVRGYARLKQFESLEMEQ